MQFQSPFILDPKLEADTLAVTDFTLSTCRLMNDSRWPWLILVPRKAGAEELFDLSHGQQQDAMAEAALAGEKLKALTNSTKINIALIGNIVRQLHIHVIARVEGDANWPNPVWGFGKAEKYEPAHAVALVAHLRGIL
ncbi:MAG: diadenosine tetraphosphate hydrolase [Hyphomicrobiales bacterium]|nr:MAG: diadenosine tetraphosphate hydrolase [Hyphomicrobiales bacterium]